MDLGRESMDLEAAEEEEKYQEYLAAFEDKAVRRGFIRKVYGIISAQLAVTSAVLAFFMFVVSPEVSYNQHALQQWLIGCIVAGFAAIIVLFAMTCVKALRTDFPLNFIMLGIFTICESICLGSVGLIYTTDSIMIAAGLTCAIVFALTIFAFQTTIDFTGCRGAMMCIFFVFFLCGILMFFLPPNRLHEIIYAGIGTLIFSIFLIIDTQLLMGGNHKYKISPEEYVFAAIAIYLDILNIFLYLLKIFGKKK